MTLWVLSNIASESNENKTEIIRNSFLSEVLKIYEDSPDYLTEQNFQRELIIFLFQILNTKQREIFKLDEELFENMKNMKSLLYNITLAQKDHQLAIKMLGCTAMYL